MTRELIKSDYKIVNEIAFAFTEIANELSWILQCDLTDSQQYNVSCAHASRIVGTIALISFYINKLDDCEFAAQLTQAINLAQLQSVEIDPTTYTKETISRELSGYRFWSKVLDSYTNTGTINVD